MEIITAGIYVLYFPNNDNLYYIGYSNDIETRITQHTNRLIHGTHTNYKLLNAYNKCGLLPEYNIIEIISDVKDFGPREMYWIEVFDSYYNGYNLTFGGEGGAYGEAHYMSTHSNEVYVDVMRKLTSANNAWEVAKSLNMDIDIVKNIAYSKSHLWLKMQYPKEYADMLKNTGTLVFRKNIPESSIYKDIFFDLVNTNLKHRQLCDKYNVSDTIIEGISCGDTHTYLKDIYPKEYDILIHKRSTRRGKSQSGKEYPPVVDPLGNVYYIEYNAKAFALSHNLHPGHFGDLLRGKIRQHKQWKLYQDL